MTTTRPLKVRGLLGNSMSLLALTYMSSLLGYVFWVLCARSVSPGAIGMANTVIAAMTLVAILAAAGFIPLLTRMLPGATPEEQSGLCSAAFLVTALVSGSAGTVASLLLPDHLRTTIGTGWLIAMVALGAVGTSSMFVVNASLLGIRRAELSLLATAVGSVSRLAAIAVMLTVGAVAVGVDASATHTILVIWIASVALSLAIALRSLSRAAPELRFRVHAAAFLRVRNSVGWDHVATLAVRAPAFVLPILAATLFPPEQVGYMAVTAMVATVFFSVAAAVSNALLAECADDPAKLGAQARRASRLIAALLLVPVVITCLFATEILSIFGPGYADYRLLLILLLLATFPDAVINVAMTVMRIQHRLRLVAFLAVAGATMSIGGSWLLMPHFGIFGAGVAVLTAQLTVALAFAAVGPYRPRIGVRGRTGGGARVPAGIGGEARRDTAEGVRR
ncbi:lipopolysaccharide biosynthesis protein [Mycobacterium sp. NAZ190054]|uniref:lipopolysaccharide biosynthesis protein n=1 Tax=Mycobacterium sp. NAZ190054 TaxID=1747766 RepID=UPI000B16E0AA|nr:hypothetical protein [Mycobacterium sp. NAZ190054]